LIQQEPIKINLQQPMQESFNNIFRSLSEQEIENNIRQTIEQSMLREYDYIIQECYLLLNKIYAYQNNFLNRDTSNLYFTYNGKSFICKIDDLEEIETELSTVMPQPVQIVTDTKNIVNYKKADPFKIYLPLFLINTRVEPTLVFDIYDNIKNSTYSFNLFTYTDYLLHRLNNQSLTINKQELEDIYEFSFKSVPLSKKDDCIELTNKYLIKLFLSAFTFNNNSEYIEEWLTYFFKTLRRVQNNLVLIGNQDVAEEIFYKGVIQQIFGFDYCITITDYILENQSVATILQNKLFIHINHIPEDEENQKKLKDLIEGIIVHDNIKGNYETIPFLCQIIFTLDQPHPFLNDFLSHSKVFFIDSLENINHKLNQADRISLLNNISKNLISFSQQLGSLDLSKVKQHSDQLKYLDLNPQEALNQRTIQHSNKISLNDTVSFKEKDYKTDNKLFENWLKDPELMKLALSYNSENPILDPFHDSFEKILPTEDRYKHTYVTGKTGSGKSELLKTLIYRDILRDDCSVILLDIHGDLAESVSRLVQDKERLVLINPILAKDMTPTINLLKTDDKSVYNIEQISQMISSVINSINVDDKLSGGMLDIMENCIPVLIGSNKRDFYDLKRFMKMIPKNTKKEEEDGVDPFHTNDKIYNKLLEEGTYNKSEFVSEYFNDEFKSVQNSTKQAVKRRLNKMLKDSIFSNLTNGKSKINLEEEMNSKKNKVIIFNIPKSKMLNTYKHYIKFIIGLIQIIALKRADKAEKDRHHTYLYIDEFHNFITPTIEEILAESRKYKLFLTLAHQSVSQIKNSNLRDIILDNTNVKIVGKNSNKTLDMMNKTLNTKLEDVSKLAAGEFNLQSGNNDVIKIRNSKKLIDGEGRISDEEWKGHKQYQLQEYYRSTLKDTNIEIKTVLLKMIKEFKAAIISKNLTDTCLKNVKKDEKIFEELEHDFNLEEPRIRQKDIVEVFKSAFDYYEDLENNDFIKMLKGDYDMFDNEPVHSTRDKKFDKDGKSKTLKYYLIPVS
jgi:hypothetical protein